MSITFAGTDLAVTVPDHATTSHAAFREWAKSSEVPEKTRTDYYKGEVWVDMATERVYSHGAVKTAFARVLPNIIDIDDGDLFLVNGVLVTNVDAELSGNPDMTFVFAKTLDAERVKMIEGVDGTFVELEGTPDMVLEIVSPSSVKKDKVTLRNAYWEAGIAEYWLVDARGEAADFRILKHAAKGYTETRKQAGWQKSNVFGKSFRLTRGTDRRGNPTFTLEVK